MKFNKKIVSKLIIYSGLVCLILISVFVIDIAINLRKQKRQSALYLFKTIDFRKVGKEQSDYLTFIWDVIDTFSAKSTRYSMTKSERIEYANENYKLAKIFDRGLYDKPIIHIMESAMNPHLKHDPYGEWGMGGHWGSTASLYYKIAKDKMSADKWNAVKFNFNKYQDLLDPINALKMTYIIIWVEEYNYDGDELYTICCYKWGRFFAPFYKAGYGLVPTVFKIKTSYFGWQTYNPLAYYYTWRNMRLCFERGDIDAGLKVYKKWKKKKDKMKVKVVKFIRLYKAMKYQEKELAEAKILIKLLTEKVNGIDKQNELELKAMRKIAADTQKTGVKKWYADFKKFCREKIK